MSIAKVVLYSQQELEAAGHEEEFKDTIVGTWRTFKDVTLSPESMEVLSKARIEKDLELLTLYEIEKILDEYAKEKGYADDQPLTLSAFYLAIGFLANRFAIEKKGPFYDFLPQGPARQGVKN